MLLELNKKQRFATTLGIILVGLSLALIFWNCPLLLSLVVGLCVFFLTGERPTSVYAITVTFRRDVTAAYRFIRLQSKLIRWELKRKTVPQIFREVVSRHRGKIAFLIDDRKMTFQEVEDLSNSVASYFKSKGFKRGDTIALLMETRPEYPAIWMGLSKIGITTALINSHLLKVPLTHSIKVADSKAIIVGAELTGPLNEIRNLDEISSIPIYQFFDVDQHDRSKFPLLEGAIDLTSDLSQHETSDVTKDILAGKTKDKLVYIYTSGTTGLPKAAVITHLRYMFMCIGSGGMLAIREKDVIYNPLPIYHTAGGMVGMGNVLLRGTTMALRKKFSASNFWSDCIKYNCTIAQYIGELCRYLLAVPHKSVDREHKIRLMFGNGLRAQIWQQFVSRFNIPEIGELYGATEGNSNLANFDSQIGAVGFVPLAASRLYPVHLIKCEEDTGEPIRDSKGRCILCKPGEAGVFIGKINPRISSSAFSGYADKKASEKKIVRNVFKKGDMYFNSGDILARDILGYFYFKDRTGDTFRWRGENVSTSEVEAVISNVLALKDSVVYGVEIPHVEGKAGMAAIVDPDNSVDMANFSIGIRGSLPPYSRPLFIRVLPELPMTGTFKLKKRDLQSEGYDINKIKDPIYYLDKGVYRRFTENDYNAILEGRARL